MIRQADDFAKLTAIANNLRMEYDNLFVQMNNDARQVQIDNTDPENETNVESTTEPMIQKELVFVNPTNVVQSMQILETEEDVDNYINKLSEELKNRIRNNKRIKLQGG